MIQNKIYKILIVDDSPESIAVLGNSLPKEYKRQVALSGASALKLLEESEEKPDLILLDVIMPKMDGFQVCKRIKRNNRYKDIPVIFISSLNETFDKVKAFKVGAVDYITKPFHPEEIIARVETHLEIAESRIEINELYSKTLQGTINAMNDIMAIANPEASNISISIRNTAEMIMKILNQKNIWDLKLASQLSGIGILPDVKMNREEYYESSNIALDIEKINEYLNLSARVIEKIPRFEPVIKILELSQRPLDRKNRNKQISSIDASELKGHILRILFHFFHRLQFENNYVIVLKEMRNDENESYLVEILDVLNNVQKKQLENKILELELIQISPDMILFEDIITAEGRILLKAGYQLSDSTIAILKKYPELKSRKIKVMNKVGDYN